MTKAFKEKEKQRNPKPRVWHKENNSHDLYFHNPRPPLTPMPVVITQHVIVITWNLFLKGPSSAGGARTHTENIQNTCLTWSPCSPRKGRYPPLCTRRTNGMNKLWAIIIKNNLCLFICLVSETELSVTLKSLGDTHCGSLKTKLLFPLFFCPPNSSSPNPRVGDTERPSCFWCEWERICLFISKLAGKRRWVAVKGKSHEIISRAL